MEREVGIHPCAYFISFLLSIELKKIFIFCRRSMKSNVLELSVRILTKRREIAVAVQTDICFTLLILEEKKETFCLMSVVCIE